MRLRTDSAHIAGWKRAHALNGCPNTARVLEPGSAGVEDRCVCSSQKPENASVPPAELDDVWIIYRKQSFDSPAFMAGYALTCPAHRCMQGMHYWDHAYNCERKFDPDHFSCWTWTGTPEEGTLTANPSLMVATQIDGQPTGACGWHGFLRQGVMEPV